MKLHEHSAIDLASLFCEELTTTMIAKKIDTIKLLIAID